MLNCINLIYSSYALRLVLRTRMHKFHQPIANELALGVSLKSVFARSRAEQEGKIMLLAHNNLIYSSVAQSVEPATVNRVVVGSSPTWGAKRSE